MIHDVVGLTTHRSDRWEVSLNCEVAKGKNASVMVAIHSIQSLSTLRGTGSPMGTEDVLRCWWMSVVFRGGHPRSLRRSDEKQARLPR